MISKTLFKKILILIILLIILIAVFIWRGDFITEYFSWLRQSILTVFKTADSKPGLSQNLSLDLSNSDKKDLVAKKDGQKAQGLIVEQDEKEVRQKTESRDIQTPEVVVNPMLDEIKKELDSINQKIQELKQEIGQIINLNKTQKEIE